MQRTALLHAAEVNPYIPETQLPAQVVPNTNDIGTGSRIAKNQIGTKCPRRSSMRLITGLLAIAASLSAAVSDKDTVRRLDDAAGILSEVIDTDKGIPRDLLDRSHCAIIVPSLKKGAFVVGAQYGKGF